MTRSTNWRLIETAPKDGQVIDLWVHWSNGDQERQPDCWWDGTLWVYYVDDEIGHFQNYRAISGEPTHWMPPPEPPS